MYDTLAVADYIVKYSNEHDYIISNLKLHKIMYFIQAGFLVTRGKQCFRDDIEAWNFGPVIPVVYYSYLPFGGTHIPYLGNRARSNYTFKDDDRKLIEETIDACHKYSSAELIDITCHQKPFTDVYNSYVTNAINLDTLRDYFSTGE